VKAIEITAPGGPEVLKIVDLPVPEPGPGEVLVRVAAAGVNRPDIQQRLGLYPPPPGASPILGLDIAGVVETAAPGVDWPQPGDPVTAVVSGGGYAEYATVPAQQCLPLPEGYDFVEAAALPEVLFTVWNSIIWLGRLGQGETLLFQGGASGVGMAAIQIARALRGARVIATAGSDEKLAVIRGLGAEAVGYRGNWPAEVRTLVGPQGCDVIVDAQAGSYTQPEMDLLADDGRLVLLATHESPQAEINLRQIVRRRLTLTGSTIRPRPPAYKGRIAVELKAEVWPLLADGRVKLPICARFMLADAAGAHRLMDANAQVGKVVLVVDPALAEDAGPA
jgi:putative PIG3 family NAD(P)H quinone oxidoreductase